MAPFNAPLENWSKISARKVVNKQNKKTYILVIANTVKKIL